MHGLPGRIRQREETVLTRPADRTVNCAGKLLNAMGHLPQGLRLAQPNARVP